MRYDDTKPTTIITIVLFILLLLLLFAGCKSKTVYVPVESVRTEYRDRLQRDSVHLYDSVFLKVKGDTVFLNKYRYLYKDKIRHDSIHIHDTIRVPYPVKGDTEYISQVKWWHEASVRFTLFAFAVLALYLGIKYRGQIFAFFRKLIFKV